MDNLSNKAKVIYAVLDKLEAYNNKSKITSYAILDYIIEESEELTSHNLLKDIPEEELIDITLDANIKSINTIITSLAKKGLVVKTEPTSITVDGTSRNLRQYFLKK